MTYSIKKVAILGGTFDPIHKGHMSFAYDVLEQTSVEEVVFMPAALQPFKLDVKTASFEDRVNMIKLAIDDESDALDEIDKIMSVSSLEQELEGVSYTYRTLDHFREKVRPGCELHFITGSDTFVKLDIWKKAEHLLSTNTFVVGIRPGYPSEEVYEKKAEYEEKYGTRSIIIHNKRVDISATEIRNALENRFSDGLSEAERSILDGMLAPGVVEYIKEKKLYR